MQKAEVFHLLDAVVRLHERLKSLSNYLNGRDEVGYRLAYHTDPDIMALIKSTEEEIQQKEERGEEIPC